MVLEVLVVVSICRVESDRCIGIGGERVVVQRGCQESNVVGAKFVVIEIGIRCEKSRKLVLVYSQL